MFRHHRPTYDDAPNIRLPSYPLYCRYSGNQDLLAEPACRPQYPFFDPRNPCCNFREPLPFNFFTKPLMPWDGRYSRCIWTWSLPTAPLRTITPSASQTSIRTDRQRFCTSPVRTECLYLVLQTICTANLGTVRPFARCSAITTKAGVFRS